MDLELGRIPRQKMRKRENHVVTGEAHLVRGSLEKNKETLGVTRGLYRESACEGGLYGHFELMKSHHWLGFEPG